MCIMSAVFSHIKIISRRSADCPSNRLSFENPTAVIASYASLRSFQNCSEKKIRFQSKTIVLSESGHGSGREIS